MMFWKTICPAMQPKTAVALETAASRCSGK